MATNRNIQMNYFNGVDYDVLNPRTTIGNISDWNSAIYSKSEIDSKDSALQSTLMNQISSVQNSLDSILDVNNGTYITSTISAEVDHSRGTQIQLPKRIIDYTFLYIVIGESSNDITSFYATVFSVGVQVSSSGSNSGVGGHFFVFPVHYSSYVAVIGCNGKKSVRSMGTNSNGNAGRYQVTSSSTSFYCYAEPFSGSYNIPVKVYGY